jgi:hypothetical protein
MDAIGSGLLDQGSNVRPVRRDVGLLDQRERPVGIRADLGGSSLQEALQAARSLGFAR